MAHFTLICFNVLILHLAFFPTLFFALSLPNFPNFDPNILLIGDAKLPIDGSSIQLTNTNSSSSSGLIVRSNPFRFVTSSRTKRCNPVSFSTDFTFSISQHNGDGLALVIVPSDFPRRFSRDRFGLSKESRYFGVEFDTFVNRDVGDENANHVGVDVGSLVSMKVSNVSSLGLVLNSGVKLHSWINYDSSAKRLEIRLSEFGHPRPYDPLLAYRVDLGEMWKGQQVLIGLSSSNGNSLQTTNVYSWKFKTRIVPKWLHSKPVDPSRFSNELARDKVYYKKKSCVSWVLLSLICGMSITLGVLFLWLIFANTDQVTVIPMNWSANSGEFRYGKINVVVENSSTDLKY